jgi:hypothetical protein
MHLTHRRLSLLAAAALAAASAIGTLSAQRPVVHGNDVWTSVSGEQRIASRLVVGSTLDERRTHGLQTPRQLLWNTTLMTDIGGGRRFGVGYGHSHTSPNEDIGPAGATSEHRVFEQLTASHHTFGLAWSHRLRYEQRWTAPEPPDGAAHDWGYTSRVRHQMRFIAPLDGRAPGKSRLYATPSVELFVTTTNHHGPFFSQSRLGATVGTKVAPRLNVETGYLRQSQIRGDGFHELHHVLLIMGRVPTGG